MACDITTPDPSFCLFDYDCIGFDMDHTIIQYHLPEIFKLIYDSIATYLVEKKGYNKQDLLDVDLQKYEDFSLRGLVFELKTGNFFKLDAGGKILKAAHGTTMMTDEEIEEEYGKDRIWPTFPELSEKLNDGNGYRNFENFFNMPFTVVIARIIDIIDKAKGGRQKRYTFWPDIMDAANENYGTESFSIKRGHFFPSIIENPGKYVKKCPRDVINWLNGLRSAGKLTFLLTQSYSDFTSFLMEHAIGKDWKNLFDLIITNGKKPAFFSALPKDQPFRKVTEDFKEGQETCKLERHVCYSGGNATTLEENAKQWLGKDSVKVVYFGDSLKSDIVAPNYHKCWDTVCVLEEIEAEEVHFQNNATKQGQWHDYEPSQKIPRIAPLLKEEKLVITSKQWGSFFHNDEDCNSSNKSCQRAKINTFWGNVVRKYSKIAIPLLDYVAILPIHFKFSSFSDTQLGFYPSPPGTVVHEH